MTPPRGQERPRIWTVVHAVADRLAFAVENACMGNGVFWFLIWGVLGFDWDRTAAEYERFWRHYVAASTAARRPVELAVAGALFGLAIVAAWIRAPRARPTWAPWSVGRSASQARDGLEEGP